MADEQIENLYKVKGGNVNENISSGRWFARILQCG